MRVIRILRSAPPPQYQPAIFTDGSIKLRDLIGFRQVGIEVVLRANCESNEWCSELPSPTEWQIPQHDGSKLEVLRVIQDIRGRCFRWGASQIGLSRSKIFWIVSQVGRGFLAQLLVQIACWCGESMTYEREAVLSP